MEDWKSSIFIFCKNDITLAHLLVLKILPQKEKQIDFPTFLLLGAKGTSVVVY